MEMVNSLVRKIRRLAGRALIRRVRYANKIRYFQVQQEGGMPLDNVEHVEHVEHCRGLVLFCAVDNYFFFSYFFNIIVCEESLIIISNNYCIVNDCH